VQEALRDIVENAAAGPWRAGFFSRIAGRIAAVIRML